MAWQVGVLNVEELRNGLDPQQLERWHQAYATGSLDDSWQQTAMLAAEIRNLPVRLRFEFFAKKGDTLDPQQLVSPEDFLPKPPGKKKKKRNRKSIDQFNQRMAEKYGK